MAQMAQPQLQFSVDNALKQKVYETRLVRDSQAIVVSYLRQYRHKVFICEFCREDWNTAQEYFDHLNCQEYMGTEEDRKAILVAIYDAKWKEIYNTIRDNYQAIVEGKRPFRAVPYCTCDTFKEFQDCLCMMEKRRTAYKELVKVPCLELFTVYKQFMRAKREKLLMEIRAEQDEHLARANQNSEGADLENMKALIERMTRDEIRQMERKLDDGYQELITAIEKIVMKDVEEIGTRGRRRIEPVTLSISQVDWVTENILHDLKCATFLVRSWGDTTGSHIANFCKENIGIGLRNNDAAKILEMNDGLEACRQSMEKCAVYYTIMAMCTFAHETWNTVSLTKEANVRVRKALCVDTIELVEEFKSKWTSHVFEGETALQGVTSYLENLGDQSEELSAVLSITRDTCEEQSRKATDLMDQVREDAKSEDWDLLGSHIFDKAVELLNYPEIPMYGVDEMLRQFHL